MLVTLKTERARELFTAWLSYYERKSGTMPTPLERTTAFSNASHHMPIPLS